MAYDELDGVEESGLRHVCEDSKRGRGRPVADRARRKITTIRFDDDELDMIRHLEIETGTSMTEIVRKAVRTYYPIALRKL